MTPNLSNSAARRDIAGLIHPYTNLALHTTRGPIIIERGDGIYVFDQAGKPYIEAMAGLWCTALGFGEEELVEAAARQMRKLPFSHLFGHRSHEPAIALAEKLKELAPVPISKVLFSGSGSEANDSVIKLVWYFNNARGQSQKKKFIARERGYHGVTVAATSLTCLAVNQTDFDMPLPGFLQTACPHHYRYAHDGETQQEFSHRLAAKLAALIEREGPETIAAFIAEPVMGAGGVIVPPSGYFEAIGPVLEAHDILLISDEVICGFGRTGHMFGCETVAMRPQVMTVAKALSSAYLPIGAALLPEEIFQAMVDESRKLGMFGHGNTYAGHPVCAAVALKTLEIMERRDVLGHVQALSPHFQAHIKRLGDHPLVGEARGVGLIGGLEIVADKTTKRPFDPARHVAAHCMEMAFERGLIVRAIGDTIAVCPPLIITPAEVDELFARLAAALDATDDWVRKDGLRGG